MIITEHFETRADGVELIRTYSDQGLKIRKSGTEEVYDEAIDVAGRDYTYFETNEPIDVDPNEEEV